MPVFSMFWAEAKSYPRDEDPTPMKLSDDEIERYARHIVLNDVGGEGQQKLKQARVLVVGAGGLGSPVLQYLAAAGVGTLGIVDDDTVSLSNLQRQVIHRSEDRGSSKVSSAKRFIRALNPHVNVVEYETRLGEDNGAALISEFDLVVDGCDSFDTRLVLSEVCAQARIPLITAAVGQFDASITTLKPYEVNGEGNPFPRYIDIFPKRPDGAAALTCEEVGIVGALTGIVGSMQALEAIKEITGAGDSLAGRLLLFEGKSATWREIFL